MDSDDDDPKGPGFPIRTSADQRALAPPRGFSQRATSFFASQCQGIHQMPLKRLIQAQTRHTQGHCRMSDVRCRMSEEHPSSALRIRTAHPRLSRPRLHSALLLAGPEPQPVGRDRALALSRQRAGPKPATSPIHNVKQPDVACQMSDVRRFPTSDIWHLTSEPVELTGIEPATSCLQSTRSPN